MKRPDSTENFTTGGAVTENARTLDVRTFSIKKPGVKGMPGPGVCIRTRV